MQGKVAIVTGAAGGIGEGIVRALGARGVRVLGTGRNAGKLEALQPIMMIQARQYTVVPVHGRPEA